MNFRGMDRNGFLTVIFLFLIVADRSSAYSFWSLRKLVSAAPKDNSPSTNISPLPGPVSRDKDSKAISIDGDKSGKENRKDPQPLDDSKKVNPKGSNSDDNNKASVNPPTEKQKDNETNHGGKAKTDAKSSLKSGSNESCVGSTKSCRVEKTMIACIQGLENGSSNLVLLVQNEGESTLKVNITFATSLENVTNEHEIPKQQTERINLSVTIDQSTKIVLKAGNGKCVLHMGPPPSAGSFLQQLPSYYKQVTPIYVAYFFFLIALIVGGTWACCQFRKRGRQDGVPYQELEMGLPDSASAVNVDTAEGWDEGWDDDWDEDKAVKSPGGHHVGNISASGLTARSSNRDGWEKDWDG